MAMWWSSQVYQNGSSFLRQNVDVIAVCSTRPLTHAAAMGTSTTGVGLAQTTTLASSDFTYSTGDKPNAGGYKLTLAQFANMTVNDAGVADHIALCGSTYGGSTGQVFYVTTCTTKNLTTSDQVTVPSFDLMDVAGPSSS